MADPTPTPTTTPDPAAAQITSADTSYESALQAVITAGSAKSAALRTQAQALMAQAAALEGPGVAMARNRLQFHRRMMQQAQHGGRGQQ
jgi:hypothetical protein